MANIREFLHRMARTFCVVMVAVVAIFPIQSFGYVYNDANGYSCGVDGDDFVMSFGGCEPGYYYTGSWGDGEIFSNGDMWDDIGECIRCPTGYICTGGFSGPQQGSFDDVKFTVTTTSDTTSLAWIISASGTFFVDCGDGGVLSQVYNTATGSTISGMTITRTVSTSNTKYSCTWNSPGAHTIQFGGTATGYSSNASTAAISFYISSGGTQAKVASISGNLSSMFPTVNGAQPRFVNTFNSATNLTSIPDTLFSNYTTGTNLMFANTFLGCTGLTSIPAGLFSGITTGAQQMFQSTFANCTNLSGFIPPTTFAGLIANGHPTAGNMWSNTFGNTQLATSCPSGSTQYITGYEGTTNGTTWNGKVSCSCGAGYYLSGGSCVTCPAGSYCTGGVSYDCPSGYPNSAAGSDEITDCYSGTRSRAWTGSQTACSNPDTTGCSGYTCNSCSIGACDYVVYSNSAGTGDGGIKSGCSTNSANCQQTVASLTPKTGYYTNGTSSCPACSNKPSNSSYTGGASSNSCPWQCDAGYESTGSSCKACSDYNWTETGSDTESITGGSRTRSKYRTVYYSSSAGGSCGVSSYGDWYGHTSWTPSCNAGYEASGESCKACSDYNWTETGSDTESITGGSRTRSKYRTVYYSSSAGGSCGVSSYGDWYGHTSWTPSCNAGYEASGEACKACSDYNWTETGSDTESITGGSRTRSKYRTVYYSSSAGGSCGVSSYGDWYGHTSWTPSCNAGYEASGESCYACGNYNTTQYDTDSKSVTAGSCSRSMSRPVYYSSSAGGSCGVSSYGDWSYGSWSCSCTSAGYYYEGGGRDYCTSTPAGYYSPANDNSLYACYGHGYYSTGGASACSTVDAGYYTTGCNGNGDVCTGQAICDSGYYCTGGVEYSCPSASDNRRTSFPENYYSPTTLDSTGIASGQGADEITDCQVLTWWSGPRGSMYEYASYNVSSGKYDNMTSYGWAYVNPGYYLTDKASCGYYAYYATAAPCPEGYYCPGKDAVVCDSSNQSTVHTTNFGLEPAPSGYYCPAGSSAASQCYKSCTRTCSGNNTSACVENATCWYNTSYYTSGTEYYGGSCSAAESLCPLSGGLCNAYYRWNGTACVGVDVGYYSPDMDDNQHACTNKPSNSSYTGGAASDACPWACDAQYYWNGSACVDPGVGYYSPANDNSRYECTNKYEHSSYTGSAASNSCPNYCDAGYYFTGTACVDVGTGYYSPAANDSRYECTNKPSNSSYTGGAASDACPWACNAGYYWTGSECAQTSAGYYSPANDNNAYACTGATYSDTSGASYCTTCPTATSLVSRVTGYWYWTSDGVHNTVNGCRADITEQDSTGDYAMSCEYENGDYGIGSTDGKCMANANSCVAGYYAPRGTEGVWRPTVSGLEGAVCIPVSTGYYSASGDLTQTECSNKPANSSYTGGASSNSCPWACDAQYYWNGSACVDPGVGYYSPANDNSRYECTNKPANSTYMGSSYQNGCSWWCDPSYYWGPYYGGDWECALAEDGYYSPLTDLRYSCAEQIGDASYVYSDGGRDEVSDCYKSCTLTCSGNETSSCPSNATCSYNTGYYTSGTQHYGGSCTASASTCPLSSFTCNAGYYWNGSSCVGVDTGYYSGDGDNDEHACSNKPEHSSYTGGAATNSCGWVCDEGYYENNGTCTLCPSGSYYCTGGVRYDCPDPSTRLRTTFPSDYYGSYVDTDFETPGLSSSSGQSAITGCRILDWVSGPRGTLYEYVHYNPSTDKYDGNVDSWAWSDVKPGYYLTSRSGCGSYAYYSSALPCPAGSYCPGKTHVVCNSSNQSTVWTENFGLEPAPSGYYCPAGSSAASQCYISVSGGHYIGTAGQNSSNWGTCSAGTAKGAHTVNYGSTSSCDSCTGNTYSDTNGAGSCTACPTESGSLASRISSYTGWWPNDVHNSINGCAVWVTDSDPNATYISWCYYSDTDGAYGGAHAGCEARAPTECAAGYYSTIESVPGWTGTYVGCYGADCNNGRVCTDVGTGYYSPAGDTSRYECTNKPSNSSYTGGAATNSCGWVCDAGYWNDNGTCTSCSANHYCPGDNTMYECPAITYSNSQIIDMIADKGYTVTSLGNVNLSSQWSFSDYDMTSISKCLMVVDNTATTAGYLRVGRWYYSTETNNYTNFGDLLFAAANTGYYLSNPQSQYYWYAIKACSNKPSNAHYTGAGTPDNLSGTVVDANDCPWVCDEGYYENNGTCTLCPAGYACSGGVRTNCASSTGPNGRQQYSDTSGASSCTECPAVTGDLASRLTEYSGWWYNNTHNAVTGCSAIFSDVDSDATYSVICYSTSDGEYGVSDSGCGTYQPTACVAGKYNTITSTTEWNSGSGVAWTGGVDGMKGKVCTDTDPGYYSPAGDLTQTQCPSGYPNSTAGSDEITDCYSGTKSRAWSGSQTNPTQPASWYSRSLTDCSNPACDYVAYSNSAGTGDGTIKSGCDTNNASCTRTQTATACKSSYYLSSGDCSACSDLASGFYPNSAAGNTGGASACYTDSISGKYVATANATSATNCAAGTYKGSHTVNYGGTSECANCTGNTYSGTGAASCTACLTNYTISGNATTDHDSATDCKISCGGGSYLATANDTSCTNVGAGYWAVASTIAQGLAGSRNACNGDWTTVGHGHGADEVGDCGRVLHVNGEHLYARSERQTVPSLNIKTSDGDIFYVSLSSSEHALSSLHFGDGTNKWTAYDDSLLYGERLKTALQ